MRLYHTQAKCWSCHPAYASTDEIAGFHRDAGLPLPELRPQSGESLVTESSWDAKIRAPDFMMDRVKTGIEAESLVRVIQAGIGGTAMPTWAGTFAPDELWGSRTTSDPSPFSVGRPRPWPCAARCPRRR